MCRNAQHIAEKDRRRKESASRNEFIQMLGMNVEQSSWRPMRTCEDVLEGLLDVGSIEGRSLDEGEVVFGCVKTK